MDILDGVKTMVARFNFAGWGALWAGRLEYKVSFRLLVWEAAERA